MSRTAAVLEKAEPSSRRLAGGDGWSLYEVVCHAGPEDRPFEERHRDVSISAVVAGSFTYTADTGRALLHPGALLLGNHDACYRCGHEHGRGDRCVSLQLSSGYFGEIAASAAGSSRFRFPGAMLPATRATLPHDHQPFGAGTTKITDLKNVVISAFARSPMGSMRPDRGHFQRERRDNEHAPPTLTIGLG